MRTERKSPREAAILAMEQVSGPVVAIVLTLCAVFIPVSFLGDWRASCIASSPSPSRSRW
jgi:multidrug efflux pump subunit AcrB